MGPNVALPMSVPVNGRGRRDACDEEEADKTILRAMGRAFLSAVGAEDRAGKILYSRALLALMNRT
ncbi:MAG: hypothetical protein FJ149_12270 [Euryarchaeota archaeon]|nr:hypothetical protein [Euryarchaeota archaeon]